MKPGGTSGVPEPKYVDEVLPEHLPDGLLSIVVFGPGQGEAILVRLPNGEFGVVDGCREPKNDVGHDDPVRELLHRFNPSSLAFVGLTHAHDDHYAGLGRLLEAYASRVKRVWITTMMTGPHAKSLIAWYRNTRAGRLILPDEEKPEGLERVITHLKAANDHHGAELQFMLAGQTMLQAHAPQGTVIIKACGPSSRDITHVQDSLVKSLSSLENGAPFKGDCDHNAASGALIIQWEKASVLLAGDLLCGKRDDEGWQYARQHVNVPIQVVNVAHHASEGAHDDALWTKMTPALAIVTPFKNAATHGGADGSRQTRYPPRPDRIASLARASVVAISSAPQWESEPERPAALRRGEHRAAFGARNSTLPITPTGRTRMDTKRNAVAASLDASGNITQLVLAGQADIYDV